MAGKSNFIVRGGADFSGIKKEMQKTQATMTAFQTKISKTMSTVGKILGTRAVGKLIKDSTSVAMSVESAMDNINRNMGNSAKVFQNWVNEQTKALGMGKAEAYKYGSTFSNLLGSFQKDSAETANSTQELMKATAIISSKTGRTYEDTANRIRSGMLGSTEAIEDLGVYTQVSMLESTEAFKKFAGNKSWAQLDFQTQQQIRLAAILEQTYARYGDTLADTTQTRQAQFVASLKNIQLSLGQAFLPIYNVILPALTRMAEALGAVINKIAQFSQALFGKANTGTAQNTKEQAAAVEGLGDATEETAKKAKKAQGTLAGFDQLNVLSKPTETTGGTNSGMEGLLASGGEIGTGITVSPDIQNAADKIKEVFEGLKDSLIKNKDIIISALGGISGAFIAFQIATNWTAITGAIATAFSAISGIFLGTQATVLATTTEVGFLAAGAGTATNAFSTLASTMLSIIAPAVAIAAAVGLIIANIILLWQKNEGFRDSVISVWENIKSVIGKIVLDIWSEITGVWEKYGATLMSNLSEFMDSIQQIILTIWNNVIQPIITNALNMLTWLWDKHLKGVVGQIGEFIMSLANGFLEIWNVFISPMINAFVEVFGPFIVSAITSVIDKFGTFIGVIADVVKGVFQILSGIIDFVAGVFTGDWKKAWNGIIKIFKGIFEGLSGIVKGVVNIAIDLINSMIRAITNGLNFVINALNKIQIKMPDWLGGGSFGLNIPTLTAPQIPKLATGAVIPPNSEFLAILGDQKSGTNIETPERLLRQIMKEELAGMMNGGDIIIENNINLEGDPLFKFVKRIAWEEFKRSGESPFPAY